MNTFADFLNSKPRATIIIPQCHIIDILTSRDSYREICQEATDTASVRHRLLTVYQGDHLLEGWYFQKFYYARRFSSKRMIMHRVLNEINGTVALREGVNEFLDRHYDNYLYFSEEADAVWFGLWYENMQHNLYA